MSDTDGIMFRYTARNRSDGSRVNRTMRAESILDLHHTLEIHGWILEYYKVELKEDA